LGHWVGSREGLYDRYKESVKPCQFSSYCKFVNVGQAPRNEEFAEVFSAFITHPEILYKGSPNCQRAYNFFATEVFQKGKKIGRCNVTDELPTTDKPAAAPASQAPAQKVEFKLDPKKSASNVAAAIVAGPVAVVKAVVAVPVAVVSAVAKPSKGAPAAVVKAVVAVPAAAVSAVANPVAAAVSVIAKPVAPPAPVAPAVAPSAPAEQPAVVIPRFRKTHVAHPVTAEADPSVEQQAFVTPPTRVGVVTPPIQQAVVTAPVQEAVVVPPSTRVAVITPPAPAASQQAEKSTKESSTSFWTSFWSW
jgi:hypothetical protein